jgi:uncharacterized protein (DUF433 family)
MGLAIEIDSPPLHSDPFGVVRVAGTRLTLDTLLSVYNRGATVEDLHEGFPFIELSDLHAVVAYYLRHRQQVDEYLKSNQETAELRRQAAEPDFPPVLKARLLASRQSRLRPGRAAE